MVRVNPMSTENTSALVPNPNKETPATAPDFLKNEKMSGGGVSTSKDDILIPMARVLQPLSPECLPGTSQQIQGAEAGDIFIKNAPEPLIKGSIGFLFQPCYFTTAVVEWKPRSQGGGGGGGYVARHNTMPSDAVQRPDPQNKDRVITVSSKTGNVYVDTRYHAGFIITDHAAPMPCYIPLSSSGHQVSKAWMLLMAQKRHNDNPVDSWAQYYKFTTKMATKNGKNWFMFNVQNAGPVVNGLASDLWVPTKEDYDRGKALHAALLAGEVELAKDDEPAHGSETNEKDIPF